MVGLCALVIISSPTSSPIPAADASTLQLWLNLPSPQVPRFVLTDPIDLHTVTRAGSRFALIQAVPDRGPIVLVPVKRELSNAAGRKVP